MTFRRTAAAVLAAAALAAGASACDDTADHTPTAPGGNVAAPAPQPAPEPAADTPTPDPAELMHAWYTNGGSTYVQALSTDMQAISDNAKVMNLDGTAAACQTFQADILAATAYQEIPDPETNTHWTAALQYFDAAARDCIAGVPGVYTDQTLINQSTGEMQQGSAELAAATQRVQEINNQ